MMKSSQPRSGMSFHRILQSLAVLVFALAQASCSKVDSKTSETLSQIREANAKQREMAIEYSRLSAPRAEWARELGPFADMAFLKIPVWQWIGLGVLLLLVALAYMIGKSFARFLLAQRDKKASMPLTASTSAGIRRSIGVLSGASLGILLLPAVELASRPNQLANSVFLSLAAVGGGLLAIALWDDVCETLQNRTAGKNERAERLLIPVIRKVVRVLLIFVFIAVGLGVFGVNLAGLIAGLGIGGIVVALAAKDSVENLFGSLTIIFDMPFALGDWVKIDKVEGVVEEINLRSTKIRTFDDSLITLPNANLIKASVENFGARKSRRIKFTVKVSHSSPPDEIEKFCQSIRDYLASIEGIVADKITVEANEYEELNLGIMVQCFLEMSFGPQELRIRHEIMLEVERNRAKHSLIDSPVR